MEEVVVVSYNMSFMSDKTEQLQFASEAAFLSSNKDKDDPRKYWKNAKDLLKKFITEQKKTCVIGLQEMNFSEEGTNTGSDAIDSMLMNVNEMKGTNYKQVCKFITVVKKEEKEDLAVSIIYDTDKFGDIKESARWDNDDKGRPTMLVVTNKNYVFITMHGAQDPKLGTDRLKFNDYMIRENKSKAEKKITEHLNEIGINETNSPTDIFLMGDLNDRYDAIKEFNILGKKLHYIGKAPKSCCYNWDSSCSIDRYNAFKDDEGNSLDYGTCTVPDKTKDDKGIKIELNDEEGWTKNYRYRGDKVFGVDPTSEIKIFEGKAEEKTSVESDHQMVYAMFKYKVVNEDVNEDVNNTKCYDSDGNYMGDVSEQYIKYIEPPVEMGRHEKQGSYDIAINSKYLDPPEDTADEPPLVSGGRKRRTRKRSGTKKSKKGRKNKKTKKRSRKTRRKNRKA
jgi:hypothetical protein